MLSGQKGKPHLDVTIRFWCVFSRKLPRRRPGNAVARHRLVWLPELSTRRIVQEYNTIKDWSIQSAYTYQQEITGNCRYKKYVMLSVRQLRTAAIPSCLFMRHNHVDALSDTWNLLTYLDEKALRQERRRGGGGGAGEGRLIGVLSPPQLREVVIQHWNEVLASTLKVQSA